MAFLSENIACVSLFYLHTATITLRTSFFESTAPDYISLHSYFSFGYTLPLFQESGILTDISHLSLLPRSILQSFHMSNYTN